jgi:hypothetical protein
LNYLVGEMTDAQGDGEAVHRVITERLKDQHIERAPKNYRFPRLGAPPVTDNCSPFARAIGASSSREAHRKINRVFDPSPARRRSIQSLAGDEAGGRSESDQFPNRWLSHSLQSSRAPHRIGKNEDSFGMTAIDRMSRMQYRFTFICELVHFVESNVSLRQNGVGLDKICAGAIPECVNRFETLR